MTLDDRASGSAPLPQRQVALIDLLDRLLTGGVVVTGDVVLSIADIDLVRVSLRALIVSISAETPSPFDRALPRDALPGGGGGDGGARERHAA
ncbi:gas vesicle protein GvpJ [Streptomyces sp. NPDC015131]|uniref:gas vesicle protein GvpJ n=1 Tax=Streptomyces sp. NPDC015131 TaxID=3364941 RepID=UPI003701C67F